MSSSRLCLLLSVLLLKHTYGAVSNTVTSSPIHVANPNPYEIHEQHQQQPAVLTQSYQVFPEQRSYYPYPQYLPTNTGYSHIQTAGQPYQMYSSSSSSSDSSYGIGGSAPGSAPSESRPSSSSPSRFVAEHQHSSSSEHHSRAPGTPAGNDRRDEVAPAFIPVPGPSSSSSSNTERHQNNYHKSRGPAAPAPNSHQAPPTFMIAPKPVLSYGAANPFLANLPPAQGPYGAPLTDAAHRGYDGSASSAPASASLDDTWEALEASLDADTRRRRHRFNV